MFSHQAYQFDCQVEPISVYTKFLVNARCHHESKNQKGSSHFCPGYSDAKKTPFHGPKLLKLQKFSDVLCSSCPDVDTICQQLFCPPGYVVVEVAIGMMEAMCFILSTEDNPCHKKYCESERAKRSVDREMAPPGQKMEDVKNITCTAADDWSDISGMDEWCAKNCPMGNDETTCLAEYCKCQIEEVTTVPTSSLKACSDWTASSAYSDVRGMTIWCKNVCRMGLCPPSHCQCALSGSGVTTETSPESSTIPPTSAQSPSPPDPTSQNTSVSRMDSDSEPPTVSSSSATRESSESSQRSSGASSVSTKPTGVTRSSTKPLSTTEVVLPSSSSTLSSPVSSTNSETSPSQTSISSSVGSSKLPSHTSSSKRNPSSTEGARLTSSASDGSIATSFTATSDSSSSTTMGSSNSTKETTTSSTTTARPPINKTEILTGGFSVMDKIICSHSSDRGQTTLTGRFCETETKDEYTTKTGYTYDIIDRVLKFAPSLMCAFMSQSENNTSCSSVFCGDSPLAEIAIKSSMCLICRKFGGIAENRCSLAYCY